MELKQLLEKGHKDLAVYIKQQCCHSGGVIQLNKLLDILLDPSVGLDERGLERCKALIAGGVPFEEFAKTGTTQKDFFWFFCCTSPIPIVWAMM